MKKSILVATLALLSSLSAHALDQCPVEFGTDDYLEKVSNVITQSASCYEASEVASACALGASGDVYTVGAAVARCEKDMPKMSEKDAATYSYLNEKCNDKYASMEGTLYMSMNAFCHLSVTKLFDELLSKEE